MSLTGLIVKAAAFANIPVATSEVHGLAQRGGTVTAGITLGDHMHGFIEKGGADLLLGLEPLEAQRYSHYLNSTSIAIINNSRILPYSVNAGTADYPDVDSFIHFLEENIKKVIYITELDKEVSTIYRNLFVLGTTCNEANFPIGQEYVEKAIEETARKGKVDENLKAFRLGLNKNRKILERR